jgi:hypothetical protein
VSSIAARLHAAIEMAARAAAFHQHAESRGAHHDDAIARLSYAADWLTAAAKNFDEPAPVASRPAHGPCPGRRQRPP